MGKINAWQCKYCDKIYVSRSSMYRCQKKCKEIAEKASAEAKRRKNALNLRDEIRLNLESIHDLPDKLYAFAKENFDSKFKLSFSRLYFANEIIPSHDAPIGKSTDFHDVNGIRYPGWSGWITGEHNFDKRGILEPGWFNDLSSFANFVRVINIGLGQVGTKFDCGVTFYLDDFPKIKFKYDKYKELHKKRTINHKEIRRLYDEARIKFVTNDKERKRLSAACKILEANLKNTECLIKQRINYIQQTKEFSDALVPAKEFEYDEKLFEELKKDFKYW